MSKEATEQQNEVMLLTRRQRRYMLKQRGVPQVISKLPFLGEVRTNLRRQNMENGRKLHEQHMDILESRNAEILEAKLESVKQTWSNIGYNAEEIKLLEEAWALLTVKDKETYREDKKKARSLMRNASELKKSRG